MKVGIIGLDTSHAIVFTEMLNDAAHEYHIDGAKVSTGFPGGSPTFSLSRNRVQGYSEDLQRRLGVTMCGSIAEVAGQVDAFLLESVDGRQHLEQFRQLALGKPVFIDKPFATATADAREIIALARATGTPIMSSSSLRYAAGIADLKTPAETVVSCEAFGPAAIREDYPGLFWYGIHSAEVLFSFLGHDCRTVRCISYPGTDAVLAEWADGRLGVMRGTRFEKNDFGCVLHTSAGTRLGLSASKPPSYYLLMQQVIRFFATGVSPVPIEETFAIVSFLEAADRSKVQGGAVVDVAAL